MWRCWLIGRIWEMAQFAGVDVVITAADRELQQFTVHSRRAYMSKRITQEAQWTSLKALKRLLKSRRILVRIGVAS